jgi:O-antigen ligase
MRAKTGADINSQGNRGKALDGLLLLLLVFAPLPAGAVSPWAFLIIKLLVMGLLVMTLASAAQPAEFLGEAPLKWTRWIFPAFLMFLIFQMIPWPAFLTRILSPNSYSYKTLFGLTGRSLRFLTVSVIPSDSFSAFLEVLTYVVLAFLVFRIIRTRRQLRRLLSWIVGMGIFQAAYGLFEMINPHPRTLLYEKKHFLDSATGTFINRNHYAALLILIIPLAVGWMIARTDLGRVREQPLPRRIFAALGELIRSNKILFPGTMVMIAALLLSKSRSGGFLFLMMVFLFAALFLLYSPNAWRRRRSVANLLRAAVIGLAALLLYSGAGTMIDRFSEDLTIHQGRLTIWRNTLTMFSDFPLFGAGLGTYADVIGVYEERWEPGLFTHASNDYIEFLSELGAVGMILVAGGILFFLGYAFFIWRIRRDPEVKGIGLGGITGIILVMLSALTDFPLHIPAVAVYFAVLLPLTLTVVHLPRDD